MTARRRRTAIRLLAAFMLMLRLAWPAPPDPQPGAASFANDFPICHDASATAPDGKPAPAKPAAHDDVACLDIHGAGHAPFLDAARIEVSVAEAGIWIGRAMAPPATGPPVSPRRPAAPPIGPPAAIA